MPPQKRNRLLMKWTKTKGIRTTSFASSQTECSRQSQIGSDNMQNSRDSASGGANWFCRVRNGTTRTNSTFRTMRWNYEWIPRETADGFAHLKEWPLRGLVCGGDVAGGF